MQAISISSNAQQSLQHICRGGHIIQSKACNMGALHRDTQGIICKKNSLAEHPDWGYLCN